MGTASKSIKTFSELPYLPIYLINSLPPCSIKDRWAYLSMQIFSTCGTSTCRSLMMVCRGSFCFHDDTCHIQTQKCCKTQKSEVPLVNTVQNILSRVTAACTNAGSQWKTNGKTNPFRCGHPASRCGGGHRASLPEWRPVVAAVLCCGTAGGAGWGSGLDTQHGT